MTVTNLKRAYKCCPGHLNVKVNVDGRSFAILKCQNGCSQHHYCQRVRRNFENDLNYLNNIRFERTSDIMANAFEPVSILKSLTGRR